MAQLSEHQELLAAIAHVAQQLNHANKFLEKIANAGQPTVEQKQPETYEQVAEAIKEEIADATPELVNNPTNPAHAAKPVTKDDLKAALVAHSKANSKEATKAIMSKYDNAKKIDDVAEENRAALIAELEA